ncbi:hypothetical protein [Psychrobacter sp. DAB_AL43B]|uniref:hypothetical protein n=1 Tax=Psychrobacter sp. DAB_AL43B TaxID=1028416 RepID=UPI0009A7173D|nr:hypothetical protein [Psychrobacter sp. DAB_AL43B]SLJ83573.1 hypothetical protein DABAL43B_0358 [Psychrobacter sp. DAB_AL43B]
MSIIDQLEQTVTPAVLGDKSSVSHVSLLEQFYAILVARLALPQVYSQLLRDDQIITADNAAQTPLFEQLWQAPKVRRTMIQELAATHHIDEFATMQLLMNAAPLAYHELKVLANGQFLPAFLQGEQPSLRHYLPTWSAPIITAAQNPDDELFHNQSVITDANVAATIPVTLSKYEVTDVSATNPSTNLLTEPAVDNFDNNLSTDAIHASPADHHLAENKDLRREKVRTRNQRNDLLLWTFVLLAAITAIGLVWVLLIKPNDTPPVETVVPAPVVVAPVTAAPAQVLTPIELIVGVDNNGSLYTCSASVGDAALQSTLQQALNTSFGEQASMCQLTVQTGVANSVANMPIEALPNMLTLLRLTPFARLHLQNDRITLEAPDSMQLQRLVTDIRTLMPAVMVDSTAPLPLPDNVNNGSNVDNGTGVEDEAAMNSSNNQFQNDGVPANNPYNNSNNVEYQAADDDTNDNVMPAPVRNNNDFNNAPVRSNGPISLSEADEMANNVIVVEPAQVRR